MIKRHFSYLENVSWASQGYLLSGCLHIPKVDSFPVVIGSHGLFSDAASPKQISLANRCNQAGIGFLRFDHRGCGSSEGMFNEVTSLESRAQDLLSAVAWIHDRFGKETKIGFFGSSMGGAACLRAAKHAVPRVMVTLAAPVESSSLWEVMEKSGEADTIDPMFRRNRFSFDLSGDISGIHHILVLHGENDLVVPVAHSEIIFNSAQNPKKRIIFPGGDHRLSMAHHQRVFLNETISWVERHLL
jgi:alpha-beta hydrolase superfamily lysophospholipase